MNEHIKESDWKEFRKIRPLVLQRYCDRAMKQVEEIIQERDRDSHDRYLEMYQKVVDGDKLMAKLFNRLSRSRAIDQLAMYYYYGLISDEEIEPFSEETRQRISSLVDFWKE